VRAFGITTGSQFESATEEKRRLQEYSEAAQIQQGAPPRRIKSGWSARNGRGCCLVGLGFRNSRAVLFGNWSRIF
jgi:hypothetical protein